MPYFTHARDAARFSPQRLSHLARREMAQRNLSVEDVAYCYRYGTRIRSGLCRFIYLRRRDIPAGARQLSEVARREGIVLHVDPKGCIRNVYRDRHATRWLRQSSSQPCPIHRRYLAHLAAGRAGESPAA